ncbi:MAG: hypothetical protein Kow00127_03730 [Bacteroidales bacterium]
MFEEVLKRGLFTAVVLSVMLFYGCDRFEGDQTLPAWLEVDTIYLGNNPNLEEGVLTHNITDVWVYVDDQLLGAWELPASIPVLAEGVHKLMLTPGIKLNGMSGTRSPYIFLRPKTYENFMFTIDSVVKRNPTVQFYDNIDFAWMEDFSDASFRLKETSNSDTTMTRIFHNPASPGLGVASGAGYTDAAHPVFEVTTWSEEEPGLFLPSGSQPVIMEMEYQCNTSLLVGMFIYEVSIGIKQHAILVLNPTGEGVWKKIYVNLTPTINDYFNADYYNVFFRAEKVSEAETDWVYLDNLKIIHRQTTSQ